MAAIVLDHKATKIPIFKKKKKSPVPCFQET